MSTIDWPDALVPQTCQLALRKSGQQFASPFNGTTQALDFIAERWVLSVSLAQMAARNPRGVGSFCNRLAGGVERVRGWNFGHNRGVPMGTLRGAPTLSAGVARGDVALPVAGALAGVNRLLGGGFEVDSNADGMADQWTLYYDALPAGLSFGPVAGNGSATAQRVSGDLPIGGQLGVVRSSRQAVVAGQAYTFSVDIKTNSVGLSTVLYVSWYDAGGAELPNSNNSLASTTSWQRRTLPAVAPAGAVQAQCYAWMVNISGLTINGASIFTDNAQWELGAVASSFAGVPTLKADDMVGCGGQLFQVAADTMLSDMGAGSVPVINRVRATITSSGAVLWDRPTAEFILPAMQAGPVYRPGAIESAALDLVEVWG